uniref:Metalloendopeptidase n=1 Tax=Oryzias latipes TaxID=8090 RepID=A0A3B3I837_ORYLA
PCCQPQFFGNCSEFESPSALAGCWYPAFVCCPSAFLLYLNAKGVILRALDQFRLKSCIDFKPRDAEEFYISIQKLDGCYSYIGRRIAYGQVLSIGSGCDTKATVEHEFLHALGFYHEQSRYDRDDYVTIVRDNIIQGREFNFDKVLRNVSTTHGTPYDYRSVMHYSKDAFTNGNGSTIITIDPKFQNVIGQRLEMSYYDVLELNRLYNCNSTISLNWYCGFSNGTMCRMDRCSQSNISWEMVTQVSGGPNSDHTTLPSGSKDYSYFMHVSTATGQEGDTAQLETQRMTPQRDCHIQCLQFYYYHSGNESDTLNIWIREFENEQDLTGTRRLMGQITGKNKFLLLFSPLGAGRSTGGFSVDDINLYETECPHLTLQIDDFQRVLNTSASESRIYSSRQYSSEGYAYRFAVILYKTYFGLYVQLLSGDNDDKLQWPCLGQQMTFQMLDQTPSIQQQMTKQWSFTTRTSWWNNPRETGSQLFRLAVPGGSHGGHRAPDTETRAKDEARAPRTHEPPTIRPAPRLRKPAQACDLSNPEIATHPQPPPITLHTTTPPPAILSEPPSPTLSVPSPLCALPPL